MDILVTSGVHPNDFRMICPNLDIVNVSNFRLAVGCTLHWLPTLGKISKLNIFSGSERYPTGLIYNYLHVFIY